MYFNFQYPKINSNIEVAIMDKLFNQNKTISNYISDKKNKNIIYYRNVGGLYWKIITDFKPKFFEDGKVSSSSRESHLYFINDESKYIALSLFNSNLWWFWYIVNSDCWALNPSDFYTTPINIDLIDDSQMKKLIDLSKKLMIDLDSNAVWNYRIHKGKNETKFQKFTPRISKNIIDEIDKYLARNYGFTEEELDFIINYDIKYRMGVEAEERMSKSKLNSEEKIQLIKCIDKLRTNLKELNLTDSKKQLNLILEGTFYNSEIDDKEVEDDLQDENPQKQNYEESYIENELLEYEVFEGLAESDIMNYKSADVLLNEIEELKGDWLSLFLSLKIQQVCNPKVYIAYRAVINKLLGMKFQPDVSVFERIIVQKWKKVFIGNVSLIDQMALKEQIFPEELHKIYNIPFNPIDYKKLDLL